MNELQLSADIKGFIFDVRGKQVMLAQDVAKLYNTETKKINQVVKRNISRFPESFCFQLTKQEYLNLRSQFVTSSLENNYGGVRYLPYVFTEHGIMMLSGLLRSDIAAYVNIKIINAFVEMRKLLADGSLEKRLCNIEQKIIEIDNKNEGRFKESDKNFEILFSKFESPKNTRLFFDGQIYDAYSLLIDILNSAQKSIIIIDNYIDKLLLDVLSKIEKKIIIITKNVDKESISKYKKQYDNVDIVIDNRYHDRFIILDKKILYHSGASFKDLGKRCFAINKIDSKDILELLLLQIKI